MTVMQLLREFHGHRLCSEQSRRQYDNIEDMPAASHINAKTNEAAITVRCPSMTSSHAKLHTSTIRYVFMHDLDGGMGSLSDIGNP